MSSKSESVEINRENETHSESPQYISRMDDSKELISGLRESDVAVPGVFGCLVATMYTLGALSPTIWGGGLIYLPAFFAGLASAMIYEGGTKNWIIGGLSGSVSALPLFVAIVELHVNIGVTAGLVGSVLLSMISAVILGVTGSHVYSYFRKSE